MNPIKIIFLDMDGVMNSHQSSYWYRNMLGHNEDEWVDYRDNSKEKGFSTYTKELCPLSCSNLRLIMERHTEARIVISSTWRRGRSPDFFNRLFKYFKIIKEDRVIGLTPELRTERGYEIADWLMKYSQPVEDFVILDDDGDMAEYIGTYHFIQTNPRTGLDYVIMEKIDKIFGGFNLKFEDIVEGKPYRMYDKPRDTLYYRKGDDMFYYQKDGSKSTSVYFHSKELFAEVK